MIKPVDLFIFYGIGLFSGACAVESTLAIIIGSSISVLGGIYKHVNSRKTAKRKPTMGKGQR